jgi:hypothetical protein
LLLNNNDKETGGEDSQLQNYERTVTTNQTDPIPLCACVSLRSLSAEAVQSAALSLEGMDHIKSSDGLSASVLGVGDGVTDDVLQEHLQHTTSLLVDQAGDALDTASARQTTNGGLRDALDVVTKDSSVALRAALA